jgi:hypothetical protein
LAERLGYPGIREASSRLPAVSPLHDPEARKELVDDLAWLWEEVRMALVALGKAREAMEVLEEEDRLLGVLYASLPREGHRVLRETLQEALRRLERAHARAREVLEPVVREEG